MSNLTLQRPAHTATTLIKPEPRGGAGGAITIRPATDRGGDLAFIDELMKRHSGALGFASYTELQSHIEEGTALIAVEGAVNGIGGTKIGYILYRDRYMKREDCGIVSQLVVDGEKRRGLVGAMLVRTMFERVPWGVRLFCLWCAQDLEANRFWEALGFKALAVRAGSRGKNDGGSRKQGTRTQIFWQRHVREGDEYPYWYPSQTHAGRMGEARLVLPIPPGKHWSEELPLVLPGMGSIANALPEGSGDSPKVKRERKPKAEPVRVSTSMSNGMRFGPPTPAPASSTPVAASSPKEKAEKPKRAPRVRQKNDPKFVAAARELRDRYLDEINTGQLLLESEGKYEVGRQLPSAEGHAPVALLNAA